MKQTQEQSEDGKGKSEEKEKSDKENKSSSNTTTTSKTETKTETQTNGANTKTEKSDTKQETKVKKETKEKTEKKKTKKEEAEEEEDDEDDYFEARSNPTEFLNANVKKLRKFAKIENDLKARRFIKQRPYLVHEAAQGYMITFAVDRAVEGASEKELAQYAYRCLQIHNLVESCRTGNVKPEIGVKLFFQRLAHPKVSFLLLFSLSLISPLFSDLSYLSLCSLCALRVCESVSVCLSV